MFEQHKILIKIYINILNDLHGYIYYIFKNKVITSPSYVVLAKLYFCFQFIFLCLQFRIKIYFILIFL